MSKEEALRLALKAMELVIVDFVCKSAHHAKKDRHEWLDPCPIVDRYNSAITAIKEALETKDEPVGWIDSKGYMICTKINESCRPLYTAPQRTWVGLTQEEFEKLINDAGFTRSDLLMMGACIEQIVDLVEAKLKEKNT